jgi:hypothetical protein
VLDDVLASARVAAHVLEPRDALADGTVEVQDIAFAPVQEG